MTFGETELLAYMRSHRLAVVASIGANGAPQSALVGIAVSSRCELVFDTTSDTRKHANLTRDPRAAVVLTGPGEQTLQLEESPAPFRSPMRPARRGVISMRPPGRMQRRDEAGSTSPTGASSRIGRAIADYGRGPLIREFSGRNIRQDISGPDRDTERPPPRHHFRDATQSS